ncbi:hypothetical protein [Rhodoferax fermentans]|uniref:Uncharacterized protein n=1 Tax=Rhodoferax fermentans TaxID=28066 RepID=A0A1T1AUC1_RHOFE|nr:hypothetical protein [Rhodoferax fermentans]MBK1684043.1 hypothetical protein [Rhodoferax fermentans]OOV07712.1 hypothetical protein RF819_14160 [Rhodoferax fermentans]
MKAVPEGVAMIPYFGDDPNRRYNDEEKELNILDSGWAKFALGLRIGIRYGHKQGQVHLRSLADMKSALDVWRVRFEGGDTLALLQAIQVCAEENLPLPSWLAVAFSEAMNDFLKPGGKHSLDLVFCSPTLPTNTPSKAAAAKQDWVLGGQLWHDCWQYAIDHEEVFSLDAVLDSVLASKSWGVKKRKARDLVTRVDESQAQHLHKREKQPLARFLEKRRKA